VHGQADTLAATLAAIASVPRSAPVRRLIFLGDLIDRGPQSLAAISLYKSAGDLANVDDVILLPGNHELMLVDGNNDPDRFISGWLDNGGDMLIEEVFPGCTALRLVELAAIAQNAVGEAFLEYIRTCPTWHKEGNIVFVHAGLDPTADPHEFLNQSRFGAMSDDHWAWIREDFLEWTGGWGECKTWILVHGHTPATMQITGLKALTKTADRVATHGRLCLDAGSTLNLAQIAWAEFAVDQYRFCMTRGE
jgi:serine/threonine protein phosphatase 1